jgi:PKD repeat protein
MKLNYSLWRIALLCLLFYYLPINQLIAQSTVRCYTDEMEAIRRQNNPSLESTESFENWIDESTLFNQSALIVGGVYQIPVVFHVVHNGEAVGTGTNISFAAMQSQLDVLNEDFRKILGSNGYNTHPSGADTEIEFCMAQRRPNGSAFPGGENGVNRINRNTAGFTAPPFSTAYINTTIKTYTYNGGVATATLGWSPDRYLNIWVCNISGGTLGYAQFPESPLGGMGCGTQSAATDGVVFLYSSVGKSSVTGFPGPYNEGRTATHEIGHWLGLRHIWGDGGCTFDDFCNDTPLAGAANYGCPVGTNSCTGAPDAGVDMIENYMDYTDDVCMNIFTNDQKMRMRIVLEASPRRALLITSDACVPPNPSDAAVVNVLNPVGDNCVGSITPSVVLRNRGSNNLTSATVNYKIDNGTTTTFAWTGSITPGNSATVTLPVFTTVLGAHTFKTWSTLPNGIVDPSPSLDTSSIQFMVSNGLEAPYSENFDGGVFPPDIRWIVNNANSDCYEWIGGAATSITGVLDNVAAQMPAYGNNTGGTENLITPIFVLPCNATAASIQFDVAYRRRNTTPANYERLYIEISENCGATWNTTPIYDKTGTVLQVLTATTGNNYYTPVGTTDWRTETVNLLPFVTGTSKNVKFRIRAVAANGNNIYLDNFRFNATTPGEIDVTLSSVNVLDGGYADLGSTPAGTPLVATFIVTNSGSTNLTLTNPITVTGTGYTLGTGFGTTTLAAGATTTFTVNFNSAVGGSFTGNVSFATNDCDEGTFNFVMYCDATTTPPIADFTGTPTTICAGSTVTFTNLSTGATSYLWSFGAGASPATSTLTNPTVTFNTTGSKTITLTATNSFGSDTETKTNYILVVDANGVALPISQGFTLATFPPAGWSIQNNNASATTWVRNATIGFAPTAGNSMLFDNFNFNDSDDDEVRLPGASFAGLSSAQLQFDVAYAPYNATNFDGLEVLVSSDCGVTFTSVYSKSNTVLATAPAITTIFTPTAAQWRTETVNLTPYIGNTKVIVAFRNLSGYGNRLFVDNINLTGVVSTTPPTASFTGTPTTVCAGQTVTYTNTSIGSPTSYLWTFEGGTPATSTATNPTVTYATAGTFDVTLIATNGGGSDSEILTNYITVNSVPSAPVVTVTNNCGNSVLSATGTGLLWSTGATTASITVPTAGTYTVTRTVGGCTSSAGSGVAAPLAVPSAPVITVTNNCGSSVLSTTGTGLLWSTGVTTTSITVPTAGIYTVTQSVGGCASAAGSGVAAPLAVPSAPVVTVTNNCGNSVLSATGSGLLWSTGATTASITVPTAGTYTVNQTVGGCASPAGSGAAAPLAVPSAPVVTVTNNCGNSVLSATGTGLLWSTGATTASITVPTAGTYTVTQTVGGCSSASGSGVAAPLAQPVITQGTLVNPTVCGASNGSITVNGTGTGNISWSGAASGNATGITLPYVITNLSAGTYSIIFTASCPSAPLSISLVDPAAPSAPVVSVTNNCGNSVLTTTGTGLLWSTGATTASITVTAAGTYTVTQTVGGCTSSAGSGVAAPIAIPSAPIVTVTNNCGNSVLNATGSGLLWSTGATTASITVPTAGTYTVTQTVGGCLSTAGSGIAAPLTVPSAPIITVTNNCGNSVLNATGTNLVWSTGATSSSITVISSGTYTVTQTLGTCISSAGSGVAAPIVIPSTPIVTVTDNCGNSVLTASGAGSFLWSNDSTTASITVSVAGTYTVTQTVGGCTSASGSGIANPAPGPAAPLVTVVNNCGNSILIASGTGPYLWSTGETTGTIIVSSAGNYSVTETISGCASAAGTGIAAPNAIPPAPVVTVLDKCGTTDLMTSASGSLMWSTSETTSLITVTMPGTYFVSQTINGCTSPVGTAVANPFSVPTVTFSPLADICINAPAYTLIEGSPAGGVYSGTGVVAGQFDPSVSGYGVFTIVYNYTDANGCSGANQQPITVGCASIDEEIEFSLSIYPNPTNGLFNVNSVGESIEKIRVIDATGRIVQVIENVQKLSEIEIDLTNFGEGIYSLEIESNGTVHHNRVILTK